MDVDGSTTANRMDAALLSVAEMYRADAFAIGHGVPGRTLMENAGAAVARAIVRRWAPGTAAILCGPGNNGGDGFVVARHLADAGWVVRVALAGERSALSGDAAWAAGTWDGSVLPLDEGVLEGADLIVDALFGAGLDRPVTAPVAAVLGRAAEMAVPTVAIDVPTGVSGDSGAVLGLALPADLTVTFFRRKPGHLLLPGRRLCGTVEVADIGIPDAALAALAPCLWENGPDLWSHLWKPPSLDTHKYRRGHVVVVGGPMTGAARLAATAALRCGAGMASVACTAGEMPLYIAGLPMAVIVAPLSDDLSELPDLLERRKAAAVVIGPGLGAGADPGAMAQVRRSTEAVLRTGLPCVVDADSLTAFSDAPAALFEVAAGHAVLTPHDGEYGRLFRHGGDRLVRAREAAAESGCVVVLKGGDTVIAAPDGRAAINANAPAWLATAGAGDVLSGMIAGLLAQGLPFFEAAAAAVWLHGAAAALFGPGLIADDLPDTLPDVLGDIFE